MALFKVTFIFNQGRMGWSETWYQTATNVQTAKDSVGRIVPPRRGLLGLGSYLEAVRISDENILGDSLLDLQPQDLLDATSGKIVTDEPWTTWLCSARAGALYRRQVWLRGLPDAWMELDKTTLNSEINENLRKAVTRFKNQLVKEAYQIRAFSKDEVVSPIVKITKLGRTAAELWRVTAPAHGFSNTNKVRIRGCKGDKIDGVNGVYEVFDVSADEFTIPVQNFTDNAFLYKGGGTARKQVISYQTITDLVLMRQAKRSTGRAFFVPRGRRRRR